MMRILLVGYGKGRLVGELARSMGGGGWHRRSERTVACGGADDPRWKGVDVAIDFTSPEAAVGNVKTLAARLASTSCWAQPVGRRTKQNCAR